MERKLKPLKDRIKGGFPKGYPGAVNLNEWIADKNRRAELRRATKKQEGK